MFRLTRWLLRAGGRLINWVGLRLGGLNWRARRNRRRSLSGVGSSFCSAGPAKRDRLLRRICKPHLRNYGGATISGCCIRTTPLLRTNPHSSPSAILSFGFLLLVRAGPASRDQRYKTVRLIRDYFVASNESAGLC